MATAGGWALGSSAAWLSAGRTAPRARRASDPDPVSPAAVAPDVAFPEGGHTCYVMINEGKNPPACAEALPILNAPEHAMEDASGDFALEMGKGSSRNARSQGCGDSSLP